MCRRVPKDRGLRLGRWQAALSRPYLPVSDSRLGSGAGSSLPWQQGRASLGLRPLDRARPGGALTGRWPWVPLLLWLVGAAATGGSALAGL